MLDELRDRISAFISHHQFCVLSTRGGTGAWAAPALLCSYGLELVCLLPYWSDVLYYMDEDPYVMIIILDTQSKALRWLQCYGRAQVLQPRDLEQVLRPGTPNAQIDYRYVAVRITAERIDLIDENRGWGARETLDL